MKELFEGQTLQTRICIALDKLECVMQYNKASLYTWIPIEYSLLKLEEFDEINCTPFLRKNRERLLVNTKEKIQNKGQWSEKSKFEIKYGHIFGKIELISQECKIFCVNPLD